MTLFIIILFSIAVGRAVLIEVDRYQHKRRTDRHYQEYKNKAKTS